MYNKDIVELCNRPQKVSGLTIKNLKFISEMLDTKTKAKTREGLCEAIIKKVYTNRLDGKPDLYNENWGFNKYSCASKKQFHSPPSPPPPPVAKSIISQPSSIKKTDNEKKGPNWNDVMSELKEKANAKKKKLE